MRFYLVLALIISIVAVIFALQNAVPVTIAFMIWQFEGSLALVLLLTLVLGSLLGVSVSMPSSIRKSREVSSLKKKIAELENTLQGERPNL